MKLGLLKFIQTHNEPVLIAVLTAEVVLVALTIVTNQYTVRSLTVEIEHEQEVARRLQDDHREISIELAKVTLPGYVVQGARELGLEVARNENTVILQPKPVPRFVSREAKEDDNE